MSGQAQFIDPQTLARRTKLAGQMQTVMARHQLGDNVAVLARLLMAALTQITKSRAEAEDLFRSVVESAPAMFDDLYRSKDRMQ